MIAESERQYNAYFNRSESTSATETLPELPAGRKEERRDDISQAESLGIMPPEMEIITLDSNEGGVGIP